MSSGPYPSLASASPRRTALWASTAVALLIHLGIGAVWLTWPQSIPAKQPKPKDARAPHTILPISQGALAKALADARSKRPDAAPARVKQTPKPVKPPPEEKLTGQVVDLPPTAHSDVIPHDARYLAQNNSHTEHESRSRHASPDFKHVAHTPTQGQDTAAASPVSGHVAKSAGAALGQPTGSPATTATPTQPHTQVAPQAAPDHLALVLNPQAGTYRNHEAAQGTAGAGEMQLRRHDATSAPKLMPPQKGLLSGRPGKGAGVGPGPGTSGAGRVLTLADLVPQMGDLARLAGGPSNDALKDVPEGEGTFLNAREFKYAAFFNRMKAQIAQRWRPLTEYQRRDPTGAIYGSVARLTLLTVTLDAQGALFDVRVSQSSGVAFLDQEGTRALRAAAPFVHPPPGLIDAQGHIVFQFGFHLDVSSGPGLRSPY